MSSLVVPFIACSSLLLIACSSSSDESAPVGDSGAIDDAIAPGDDSAATETGTPGQDSGGDANLSETALDAPATETATACTTSVFVPNTTPCGLTNDGSHLYWSDINGGGILRMPLGGGAPQTLLAKSGGGTPVAVDGDSIYWVDGEGHVQKLPKAGAAAATAVATDTAGAEHLVLVDDTVFWTSPTANAIRSVAKSGGTPKTVTTVTSPSFLAAFDKTLYFVAAGGLKKVGIAGGDAVEVSSTAGIGSARHLFVDSTGIYLTSGSSLYRIPLAGGAATAIGAGPEISGGPSMCQGGGIGVRNGWAYWAAGVTSGVVLKVAIDKPGALPVYVATIPTSGGELVTGTGFVYFSTYGFPGAIYRACE